MSSRSPRSRGWCFTLNNPGLRTQATLDAIQCDYIVFQEEKGMNGTTHVQGFVYFGLVKGMSYVRKLLPRAHWEQMRGTPKEASDYCEKEETRATGDGIIKGKSGSLPAQGERVDLMLMKKDIDEGATLDDLWEKHFSGMVRYERAMREYMRRRVKKRTWVTRTKVFYGKTGTGKSFHAHAMARLMDEDYVTMVVQEKGKFWMNESDSGRPPKCVVIEDYAGEIPFRVLLQMLDEYACTLPVKGGFVKFNAKLVIITSNLHPKRWYPEMDWESSPLRRRLTTRKSEIKEFTKVYVPMEDRRIAVAIAAGLPEVPVVLDMPTELRLPFQDAQLWE